MPKRPTTRTQAVSPAIPKRPAKPRQGVPTAIEEFREALARKGPQAIIAKETGVSTKTLSPLLKGQLPPSKDKGGRLTTEITPQRIRGVVPAIARLLRYAEAPTINFEELIGAYGIPLDADSRAAIDKAARAAGEPESIHDVVTRQIHNRDHTEVILGAIAWPPFLDADESPDGSLAYRFLISLFGSIYPSTKFSANPLSGLKEAIDALVKQPAVADVVFGMYELPARAAQGLRFIPLPGISVALGALRPKGARFTWRDILGLSGLERPFFVVAQEEAGDIFLQGVCRKTLATPKPTETTYREPEAEALQLAARLVGLRAQRPHHQPTGLLIESMTCKLVKKQLDTRANDVAQRVQELYPRLGAVESSSFEFEFVEPDPDLTPRYPLGIAIRSDADRFSDLINLALDIEVFGTAIGRTAQWYFDLLRRVFPLAPSAEDWKRRDGIHFDLDGNEGDLKVQRLLTAMKALAAHQSDLAAWIPPVKDQREVLLTAINDLAAKLSDLGQSRS